MRKTCIFSNISFAILILLLLVPSLGFCQDKTISFSDAWKIMSEREKSIMLIGVRNGLIATVLYFDYAENMTVQSADKGDSLAKIRFARKLLSDFLFSKDGTPISVDELRLRIDLLVLDDKYKKEELWVLVFHALQDSYLKKNK